MINKILWWEKKCRKLGNILVFHKRPIKVIRFCKRNRNIVPWIFAIFIILILFLIYLIIKKNKDNKDDLKLEL